MLLHGRCECGLMALIVSSSGPDYCRVVDVEWYATFKMVRNGQVSAAGHFGDGEE